VPERSVTPVTPTTVQRSGRSQTRGFLFADIRGYTEYLDRHGATEAADLLLRYRAIVRDAITQNDGAEIRTEGDSFYVVLRSASDAVMCGLAIVEGVAAENAKRGNAPIRVGVGVHAGEAIDTAEGLVGGAVNVAARVCALAGPGTVLVTETVRGLAHTVVPVVFVRRGRHRLKGVAEPIELYAAQPAATARATVGSRAERFAAIGALGMAAVALAALAYAVLPAPKSGPSNSATSTALADAPAAAPSPSTAAPSATTLGTAAPSPSPLPGPTFLAWNSSGSVPAHLHDGAYQFSAFRPTIAFDIDATKGFGADWWFTCGHSDFASLAAWDTGKFLPGVGQVTLLPGIGSPCFWQGNGKPEVDFARSASVGGGCTPVHLIRSPQDLVEWISQIEVLKPSTPTAATVDGRSALSIETEIDGDVGKFCGGTADPKKGLDVLRVSSDTMTINPGDRAEFIALDVGQESPLIIHAESPADAWTSARTRLEALFDTLTVSP